MQFACTSTFSSANSQVVFDTFGTQIKTTGNVAKLAYGWGLGIVFLYI
jgi:hypothetical protein